MNVSRRLAIRTGATLVASVAGLAVSRVSGAATYPDKPIKLIVPWATGGSTDALARVIAQRMSSTLGQEILVENRAGAGGSVGVAAVAKSPADGYTLTVIELPHAIAPALVAKLPYDLQKDFAPIGLIGTSAMMLFTNASNASHQTVGALLTEARAKPGQVAIAHSGNGTLSHLAAELLQARTGTSFNLIPYRGSGPALTDVAGGLVAAHFATPASASALLSAGRIKAVAVASTRRLPVMPEVPTMAEQTISDFVMEQWWGLVAPAGTPPLIVERLRAEMVSALGHTSVRERLRLLAVERQSLGPAEFGRFIAQETERWTKVARAAGLKPE